MSSLDIIIKLKTTLTTSQILNLTALSAQTSWMFGFCHLDDVITSQHKQTFGFALFDNFFKHLLTLKTNHDMQVGFMM